jgi:hypothetical protein
MKVQKSRRAGEKGAALVTALMMASLLLTGCIALLAGASLNTANVTDAVAEQQAYNAAESGIQTAINVLRRNTVPSVLINNTQPATHQDNKIDYARAINKETSNLPTDTNPDARLSRWISYDYTPPGATNPDRASIGEAVYNPQTGSAFSVTVRDPDNPDATIALNTSASIDGGGDTKDFGSPLNSARIKYNSVSSGNVKITTRQVGINLGSFTISKYNFLNSNSTAIPDTPFTITVKMTAPLPALIKLRGTIKAGNIGANSVGSVKIAFDSPVYSILGSIITLPVGEITPNAPNVNSGKTDLSVTITLSQPRRLVIRSVGYGPRGARKVFEAIVKRDNFDGLIPATITLVGSASGSIFKSSTDLLNQQVTYSGSDALSNAKIPPIGTIGGGGLLSGLVGNLTGSLCVGCNVSGTPADISSEETPDFLKSTANLNNLINEYRETARASGRYYSGGATPDGYGNNAKGTGITFIDGDGVLIGNGGGILIVTGKLTLTDAFNFNGTILATGKNGVARSSGNSGTVNGNLVVAPYKANDLAAGFLSPKYDITGGTSSNITYTASNILFGSDNYNTVVVSVGEK